MYLAKMYEWEDQREGLRSVIASVTLDRPVTVCGSVSSFVRVALVRPQPACHPSTW